MGMAEDKGIAGDEFQLLFILVKVAVLLYKLTVNLMEMMISKWKTWARAAFMTALFCLLGQMDHKQKFL